VRTWARRQPWLGCPPGYGTWFATRRSPAEAVGATVNGWRWARAVRHLPVPREHLIRGADLCIPQRCYGLRILGTLGNVVQLHRYEGRMVDAIMEVMPLWIQEQP
jgi:hypothetical protein